MKEAVVAATVMLASALLSGCAIADRMSGTSQARELQRIGVPADALILNVWDTGITVNDDPVIGLDVSVRAADGTEYETKILKSRVSRVHLPQFQPGERVPVRVDPRDPKRVALDVYRY
jgi:hypothetical protein